MIKDGQKNILRGKQKRWSNGRDKEKIEGNFTRLKKHQMRL